MRMTGTALVVLGLMAFTAAMALAARGRARGPKWAGPATPA